MTYADDVASVEDGRPVHLYTIELPSGTHRLTSHDEDIVNGGNTYLAADISSGPTTIVSVGRGQVRQVIVTMGLGLSAAQAALASRLPQSARLTLTELQLRSGDTRQIHRGPILTAELDGIYARFGIPHAIDHALSIALPFAVASRTCNHAHYDNGCQEPRGGANQISPTVASVSADGLTITISSIGGKPDQWAQFGEIVRVADGERRLVRSQIGTALVIDRRFLTLANGNALEVHAGCDHTVETCRDKFDNVTNFGGHPDLPVGNPTAPAGLGTIVQE